MKVVQTSSTVARLRWLAIISAAALSLSSAACSGEQTGDSSSGGSTANDNSEELGDPTAAELTGHDGGRPVEEPYGCAIALTFLKDVDFIDFMVPHHVVALRMDELLIKRGEREDVRELARKDKEDRIRHVAVMLKVREKLTGKTDVPEAPQDRKMDMDFARMRTLSGKELDEFYLRVVTAQNVTAIEVSYRSLSTLSTRTIRKIASDSFERTARQIAKIAVLREKFDCAADVDAGDDQDPDKDKDKDKSE
jgi:uncharacterized protein (DUF305 family)